MPLNELKIELPLCTRISCKWGDFNSTDLTAHISPDIQDILKGDVFLGSNLENRDGLGAVTGVPGHAHAAPS